MKRISLLSEPGRDHASVETIPAQRLRPLWTVLLRRGDVPPAATGADLISVGRPTAAIPTQD
jgi:hypothetical protein